MYKYLISDYINIYLQRVSSIFINIHTYVRDSNPTLESE